MLFRFPQACRKSFILRWILACISGGASTLAFAPTQITSLAILAPALLIILWHKASPKQAFWLGFSYGISFFSTSVWWVIISLHRYGNLALSLAWLLAMLFFSYLAIFPALTGWLAVRFVQARQLFFWGIVPSLWVLTEWLRSTLFTGFPWMLLGYSQTDSWLSGLAPIIGTYGLSWVCMVIAGMLAYAIIHTQFKVWLTISMSIASLYGISYYLTTVAWTSPKYPPISVSLIQGNILQTYKWQRQQLLAILQIYLTLIEQELGRAIIIIPEAALPAPSHWIRHYLKHLDTLAKHAHSAVIVGIPVQPLPDTEAYYNALYVLGIGQGHYYKRHLVPFGEYLTFFKGLDWLLRYFQIPMASFVPGPAKVLPFQLNSLILKPLICYEIAYSDLVYDALPTAEALVVVSDDSWFGESVALDQHLQIARMRALETRRYVLFDSNTGPTAIINPFGTIIAKIPLNQRAILRSNIVAMQGQTPVIFWKNHPILWLSAGLFAISIYRRRHN